MKIITLCVAWTAILALAALSSTHGATLTVANHSFENPVIPDDSFNVDAFNGPPGWNIFSTALAGDRTYGVLNPNGTTLYSDPVPDGDNVGVTFLSNTGGAEGGLEQTLSSTLELNTQYTLTVEIGNLDNTTPPGPFDFSGFPGYRVELLAGLATLAMDNNSLSPAEGRFLTSTVTFSTGGSHANFGEALGIRLVNLNGAGIEVNFDNVRLETAPVPEPATWALASGGLLLAFGVARRRSRASRALASDGRQ